MLNTADQMVDQRNLVKAKMALLFLLSRSDPLTLGQKAWLYGSLGRLYFSACRYTESRKLDEAVFILLRSSAEMADLAFPQLAIAQSYVIEWKLLEARALLNRIIEKLTKHFRGVHP